MCDTDVTFQDAENGEMGRNESPAPAKTKVVGARKKYRSRSTSASSQDSLSSGSYSGQYSTQFDVCFITLYVNKNNVTVFRLNLY